jgi:NADPH:quinone reductase-like Zn-dependent oxidoreductase
MRAVQFNDYTAGRGALVDLIEITGSPDSVVTTADFTAAEHGLRATSGADKRAWRALGQAAELYEAGQFSMPVEHAFPLDQAPEAQRISQAGHVRGKPVLIVD